MPACVARPLQCRGSLLRSTLPARPLVVMAILPGCSQTHHAAASSPHPSSSSHQSLISLSSVSHQSLTRLSPVSPHPPSPQFSSRLNSLLSPLSCPAASGHLPWSAPSTRRRALSSASLERLDPFFHAVHGGAQRLERLCVGDAQAAAVAKGLGGGRETKVGRGGGGGIVVWGCVGRGSRATQGWVQGWDGGDR